MTKLSEKAQALLDAHVAFTLEQLSGKQLEQQVEDLIDLPMVLLDLPFSTDYFLSFFAKVGLTPVIAERTRDMGVMRAMVANGFGYSIANIRLGSDRAPDGRRLVYLAYPPGTLGHPEDLPVALVLCNPDGDNRRRIRAHPAGARAVVRGFGVLADEVEVILVAAHVRAG